MACASYKNGAVVHKLRFPKKLQLGLIEREPDSSRDLGACHEVLDSKHSGRSVTILLDSFGLTETSALFLNSWRAM